VATRLAWAAVVGSFVALGMVADLRALLDGVTHVLPTGNGQDPIQEAWFLAVTRGHCWPATHRSSPTCSTCRDRSTCSTTRVSSCRARCWRRSPWPPGRRQLQRGSGARLRHLGDGGDGGPQALGVMAARRLCRRAAVRLLSVHGRQTQGHLNLAFVAVIPLLLAALDELVVRQRWNPFGVGAVLGALGVAQFFTSVEMLVDTAVVAAIGLLFLVVARPHEVARRARHVASGLAIGFGVFAVVVAYPATIALTGEGHTMGPIQAGLGRLSNDLVSPVATTPLQLFHTGSVGATLVGGDLYENGGALGILLLIALALVAIKLWREPVIRFAVAMAVCAFGSRSVCTWRSAGREPPSRCPTRSSRTGRSLPRPCPPATTSSSISSPRSYSPWVPTGPPRPARIPPAGNPHGSPGPRVVGLCLLPLVPAFPFGPARSACQRSSTRHARPSPRGACPRLSRGFQDHDQAMLWRPSGDVVSHAGGT